MTMTASSPNPKKKKKSNGDTPLMLSPSDVEGECVRCSSVSSPFFFFSIICSTTVPPPSYTLGRRREGGDGETRNARSANCSVFLVFLFYIIYHRAWFRRGTFFRRQLFLPRCFKASIPRVALLLASLFGPRMLFLSHRMSRPFSMRWYIRLSGN